MNSDLSLTTRTKVRSIASLENCLFKKIVRILMINLLNQIDKLSNPESCTTTMRIGRFETWAGSMHGVLSTFGIVILHISHGKESAL